tara:strand:+ start:220 stop:1173 length:954 start_codon:yes stop_codon:yes gene_type:complete
MRDDLISSINKKVLTNKELIALKIIFNSNNAVYKLIEHNLSLDEIVSLNEEQLKGLNFRATSNILDKLKNYDLYEQKSIDAIDWCEDNAVKIISIFDSQYPKSVKEISHPSCLIFCLGNIDLLKSTNSIAVIGTRKCSEYGEKIAAGVSNYFASNDINIISGLALGIDTIAHEQSLKCNGKTTGVLIDLKQISPHKNINLARKIVESDGLLIAENVPGTLPEKYHYLARNRLQSALSKCVFIIEASLKSGTNATAEFAISQNKKIYCPDYSRVRGYSVPSQISELPQKLTSNGLAESFTKDNYDQILEFLTNDTPIN